MIGKPNPTEWPFEVTVRTDEGQSYSQFARDNGDGTVTYLDLEFPAGFVEKTVSKANARLKERPWEIAKRWQELFQQVYGPYL